MPTLVGTLLLTALGDTVVQAVAQVAAMELAGEMHASADEGAWLTWVYVAARVVGLVAAAPWMARLGAHQALVLATLGGALCTAWLGASASLGAVLLTRGGQGLFGGMSTAGAYALLVGYVPKHQHVIAQALWGAITLVAPALFAAVAGCLVDRVHWQPAMLLGVPFYLAASACLWATRPARPWPERVSTGRDGVGLVLFAACAGASQWLMLRGTRFNWGDTPFPATLGGLLVLGVSCAVAWHRIRGGRSLWHVQVWALPEFTFACSTSVITGYAATGTAMLAPMYVRQLFGYTATDAGALQLPSLVPIMVGLVLSALLTHLRWASALQLIVTGLGLVLASLVLWSQATWQVDMQFVATVVALRGSGLGLMAVPTAIVAFSRLTGADAVFAAGYYQLARQLGGALATLTLTWRLAETHARYSYALSMHASWSDPSVLARLQHTADALVAHGLPAASAPSAQVALATRALGQQVLVLCYNACFVELALVYGIAMVAALMFRALTAKA